MYGIFTQKSVNGYRIGMSSYDLRDVIKNSQWNSLEFNLYNDNNRPFEGKRNNYSYQDKGRIDWSDRGTYTITIDSEYNMFDKSGQYLPSSIFLHMCRGKIEEISVTSNKNTRSSTGKKLPNSEITLLSLKNELKFHTLFENIKLVKLKNQPNRILARYEPSFSGKGYLFGYSLDYEIKEYRVSRVETIRSNANCYQWYSLKAGKFVHYNLK